MWITDLLQAGLQTENTRNAQNTQAADSQQQSSVLQKEIRALTPGQILSGQILERNGEELKLLVNFGGSELELQARLEQNIALSMGKNILFQVKNNGSSLFLSPLFENMGMEANAQKAIEMASLPVNDTSMQLTGQLMKEGMPIDKETLQNFYREVTGFADAEIIDIIDLHKLGMEVNQENLEQISSYKNMTHQLTGGINALSQQLPQLLQELASQGLEEEIGRLLETLLLQEDGTPAAGLKQGGMFPESLEGLLQQESQMVRQGAVEAEPEIGSPLQGELSAGTKTEIQSDAGILWGTAERTDALSRGAEESGVHRESLEQSANRGAADTENLAQALPLRNLLQQAAQALAQGRELPLKELVKLPEFQKQLQQYVKQELSLRPEDISKEKLDQVYSRLSRQLGALSEALSSAGQEGSALGKTVQNLQQNIHFMNQLNDLYTYVQLPLKMMDNDAHGELYVYTNKRKLAAREGEVSALLHLDMANLGPMDIYVQLKEKQVSTRFYLPDEEMLDFLADHMDLLNERLGKRGYHMNCGFQVRQQEGNGVMQELIEEQSNRPLYADYSFDAFA